MGFSYWALLQGFIGGAIGGMLGSYQNLGDFLKKDPAQATKELTTISIPYPAEGAALYAGYVYFTDSDPSWVWGLLIGAAGGYVGARWSRS